MNDDEQGIFIGIGAFILLALLGGGSSEKNNNQNVQEHKSSYTQTSNDEEEESYAKDYKSASDVIRRVKGLSVYRKDGELSRAIEPNHRVNGFNGVVLE